MPVVTVVRTYLEMVAPDRLAPFETADPALHVERVRDAHAEVFRRLYVDVGGPYHWRDRLALSDAELAAHFARADVALWVMSHDRELAGFFELCRHEDGAVEIVYFGIVRRFFGRGYGKHLLTRAVQEAWRFGATRVWLHTCTLDAPAALPNYLARGFEPVRTLTYETDVPDPPGA